MELLDRVGHLDDNENDCRYTHSVHEGDPIDISRIKDRY